MRVLILSGSGLSADSGLPTFRGAGGFYEGMKAEEFLSASTYARDPGAVEAWIERLRRAAATVEPNAAHQALASYQARYPDTVLLTQNIDLLLERAGATEVVHLHGRLDQLRCLDQAHTVPLTGDDSEALAARCIQCRSQLRSDVILFEELAPAYRHLWRLLRHARRQDVLVVVGTQGNVLPIKKIARAFPGRSILNNLHESVYIPANLFTEVVIGSAAEKMGHIVNIIETWRHELEVSKRK